MRALDTDIWIEERPQRFYGLPVGTRMTLMRLADGSLLLHSPVSLDAALRAELDALGPVRYAVAPNRVHHLYAGEVARAYPASRLWVGPGVPQKRPDLVTTGVLDDEAPPEWRGQVDQVFFRGRPSVAPRPAADPRPRGGTREPGAHPRLGLRPRRRRPRRRARGRRPRGAAQRLRLAPAGLSPLPVAGAYSGSRSTTRTEASTTAGST